MLDLDYELTEGVEALLAEDEIFDILSFVLDEEKIEKPCNVSVSIVSDEKIHELNRDWRDVDRPTDVISLECESPDDPDLGEDEPCTLGDLILAPAYIREQAARMGTTPADEFRLLLIHGMLHLLGYDHIEEAEAELMEAREDELLARVKTDEVLGHVSLTRHSED